MIHICGFVLVLFAVPYFCTRNNVARGGDCTMNFTNIDITALTEQTQKYASSGMIDTTSHMLNDRVYIFHGTEDPIISVG